MTYNEVPFEDNIDEAINFKRLFTNIVSHWYFFVLLLALALSISFLYNKYKVPVYRTTASILIQDEQNPLQQEILQNTALLSSSYTIENEKGILTSKSLVKQTINQLNYRVFYYNCNRFSCNEIYKHSPFMVEMDSMERAPLNTMFYIKENDDNHLIVSLKEKEVMFYDYRLNLIYDEVDRLEFSDTVRFGETFYVNGCGFKLIPNLNRSFLNKDNETYGFKFLNPKQVYSMFSNFSVESNKYSSIITLLVTGENKLRLVEFLQLHTQNYLSKGITRKTRIAQATIDFIDSQLEKVSDSLLFSESELQDFRSKNKLIDINYQTQKIYGNLESLNQQQQELQLNLQYYNYLIDYIKKSNFSDEIVAPSVMGISDQLLNSLVINLSSLTSELNELKYNSKKDNPYINNIELRITDAKDALTENLRHAVQTTTLTLNNVREQMNKASGEFSTLPSEQRQLVTMERNFKLNDELYTYLLKKKSEMQILKASTMPTNEIVDSPGLDQTFRIKPNKRKTYFISIILALFLPVVFFYLQIQLNNKIVERSDIEKITQFPILGTVAHNKYKTNLVVSDHPNSYIADSFRTIRTNFKFLAGDKKCRKILITSSVMGEGKSFVSLNLASIFALNNQKVVLVDFDLRKARIQEYANTKSEAGISLYLSGLCNESDLMQHSPVKNLDIINVGVIPPNPTELVESQNTLKLLKYLEGKYDIILLDTPPLGSVSDALILMQHTDINLFVVRNNYTVEKVFSTIIKDLEKRKLTANLLVNDISKQYGYGYHYGYYGSYSYYNDKPKSIGKSIKDLLLNKN